MLINSSWNLDKLLKIIYRKDLDFDMFFYSYSYEFLLIWQYLSVPEVPGRLGAGSAG